MYLVDAGCPSVGEDLTELAGTFLRSPVYFVTYICMRFVCVCVIEHCCSGRLRTHQNSGNRLVRTCHAVAAQTVEKLSRNEDTRKTEGTLASIVLCPLTDSISVFSVRLHVGLMQYATHGISEAFLCPSVCGL